MENILVTHAVANISASDLKHFQLATESVVQAIHKVNGLQRSVPAAVGIYGPWTSLFVEAESAPSWWVYRRGHHAE